MTDYLIEIEKRWIFPGYRWRVWSNGYDEEILTWGKSPTPVLARSAAEFAARNLDNPPWNKPPKSWSYTYTLPEDE